MKRVACALATALIAVSHVFAAADEHRTIAPPGTVLVQPGTTVNVPCDLPIRYDDGSEDGPGSGPTLGGPDPANYQYLGVVFSPPAGNSRVQSASWFSDFWVIPGLVDVKAFEVGNPGNSATVTVNVTGAGTWEVEFPSPICIPNGGQYVVMLCPHPGVWGVVGEDIAAPDGRSYSSFSIMGCEPHDPWSLLDFMLWSCVGPCVVTPTRAATWGTLKIAYR